MAPYFTIGHSTHSLAEFAGLLQAADVRTVADVRSIPRSRTNPQFNADVIAEALGAYQISYLHITELGGRRGHSKDSAVSPNTFWEHPSFRNYADYAATGDFRKGLSKLLALGAEKPTAIMCAEAVWWRCHRRIIADYLLAKSVPVFHIMPNGKIEAAKITLEARVMPDGTIVYFAANKKVD